MGAYPATSSTATWAIAISSVGACPATSFIAAYPAACQVAYPAACLAAYPAAFAAYPAAFAAYPAACLAACLAAYPATSSAVPFVSYCLAASAWAHHPEEPSSSACVCYRALDHEPS